MTDFNKLCKLAERISPADYALVLAEKSAEVLPKLYEMTDGVACAGLFASFLMASVCADGKLDEAEYVVMLPLLKAAFGDGVNYEAAKEIAKSLRPESRALKNAVDEIVDELGKADEKLKDDIILICLLVCAIDGKITLKEKRYIKQLIR